MASLPPCTPVWPCPCWNVSTTLTLAAHLTPQHPCGVVLPRWPPEVPLLANLCWPGAIILGGTEAPFNPATGGTTKPRASHTPTGSGRTSGLQTKPTVPKDKYIAYTYIMGSGQAYTMKDDSRKRWHTINMTINITGRIRC